MRRIPLNATTITLVIANLIPLIGVFFLGWEPLAVFVIYIFESVIAGLFNLIKMLSVSIIGNKNVALRKEPGDSGVSGFALIPFFTVHYFFFVFIQCVLFFAYAGIGKDTFSPLRLIENFKPFICTESGWAAGGLALSYTVSYSLDFMLNGEFTRTSLSQLFFRPYKRIFVQQFVVLLGGWVFVLSSVILPKAGSVVFVTMFTFVKIAIDLFFENSGSKALANYKFD